MKITFEGVVTDLSVNKNFTPELFEVNVVPTWRIENVGFEIQDPKARAILLSLIGKRMVKVTVECDASELTDAEKSEQ